MNLKMILYLSPGRFFIFSRNVIRQSREKTLIRQLSGDTMYKISQQFGVKLKSLYEMNRMAMGSEPEAGEKIWLRSIKPVQ